MNLYAWIRWFKRCETGRNPSCDFMLLKVDSTSVRHQFVFTILSSLQSVWEVHSTQLRLVICLLVLRAVVPSHGRGIDALLVFADVERVALGQFRILLLDLANSLACLVSSFFTPPLSFSNLQFHVPPSRSPTDCDFETTSYDCRSR